MIAFVDIAIVVLMIYSLLREGYPRFQKFVSFFTLSHHMLILPSGSSRKMIFRLIVLTINTGLWTAVFAIVDLVLVGLRIELLYFHVDRS